ncbi:MAG: HEPN domain-containing protein [Alphaproteobacteria bacterium]|nr:HEPN domain-containing protein [Alphaproteobacteria bacterium]
MKGESALYLDKARRLAAVAARLVADRYADDAGRDAYLAVYHAAQAFVFEHAGHAAKTHNGVHTKFAELAQNEPRLDDVKIFLPQAYALKAITDYELGEDAALPLERARAAVEKAGQFVARIAEILESSPF